MRYIIVSLGLAALVSSASFGNEPQEQPAPTPTPRPQVNAATGAGDHVIRVPARISAICEKAKGDTATICAEYETLYVQVERQRIQAARRMEELTRGGVVDTLR